MGLLSKTVMMKWSRKTCTYYKNKGYIYTKIGDEFEVKVEDLQAGSGVYIKVKCDNCGKEFKNIKWIDYKRYVRDGNIYYCQKCAVELYGREKSNKTKIKNRKSFEQWCYDNLSKEDAEYILNRWDYKLNNGIKPNEICFSTTKKYYFKCPREIHKSELKDIHMFIYDKNALMKCKQCNSFAQWGIDNIGKDFLEKYWDYERNKNINPWQISYGSNKKVYIKCQEKDYHGSYKVAPDNFKDGNRCPYCNPFASGKIYPLDSLGKLLEDKGLLHLFSNKNKKSPYEYAPMSQQEVYWKCTEGHNDYKRKIVVSNDCDFRCPECVRERDESFLQEKVRLYLESLEYTVLHENNCTIIPINPKTNYQMPFDNDVLEMKLIIEVHGIQHYKVMHFHNLSAKKFNTTPEYELHMQQVRDRYKRIYAKLHDYEYLEIPYWTDDKEETWKELIDNKINNILNNLKEVS